MQRIQKIAVFFWGKTLKPLFLMVSEVLEIAHC